MGLSIFVMPLWRFKVGDFRSPIDIDGKSAKVVTADGVVSLAAQTSCLDRWRARRQVASISRTVARECGAPIQWSDEGGVVYSDQGWRLEALRAYAMWRDCRKRLPVFDQPPDNDYYKHPAMVAGIAPTTCPQLVGHSCYSGYFLPCEFNKLVAVEPYVVANYWHFSRSVGSTPKLLRELDILQAELQVPDDYMSPPDDPLRVVKVAYQQLRQPAELSMRHGLPIVFSG